MHIHHKLNELANLYAMRDAINLDKAELVRQAIPPEVQARLDEIEAEFSDKLATAAEKAAALEAEIKQEIIQTGASYKADFLHAVYAKGRITWDSKGLDGYAVAHPEVAAFRKVGEPSVSIRKV